MISTGRHHKDRSLQDPRKGSWKLVCIRGRRYITLFLQMPKGALLHAHLDATVNQNFVLQLALQQPALHVRTATPINATTIGSTLPEFRALPQNQFAEGPGVTDVSYVANEWVSLQQARNTFDPALGGPHGFDKWVLSAITINPKEAYETHNTVKKVGNWSSAADFMM